jgi:hypothetical protein
METACVNCMSEFAVKKKGFQRYSLNAATPKYKTKTGSAVDKILASPITPGVPAGKDYPDHYLCLPCYSLLGRYAAKSHEAQDLENSFLSRTSNPYFSKKRKRISTPAKSKSIQTPKKLLKRLKTSTPRGTPFKTPQPLHIPQKGAVIFQISKKSLKATAMKHVSNSNYYALFNFLVTRFPAAGRAFLRIIKNTIRREMHAFTQIQSYPSRDINLDTIEQFDWRAALEEGWRSLPTFFSAMVAALSPRTKEKSVSM